MAGRYDRARACAGDEARGHELGEVGRPGAPEIAGRRKQAAERKRRAAPEHVGQPPDGHGDEEARKAVYGDGHADGGRSDVERLRVERQHRHDGPEAELVDADQHAHPEQAASLGW